MGIMSSYTKSIVDGYFLFILYYSILSKPDEVVLVSISEKLYLESLRTLQVAMRAVQRTNTNSLPDRQDSR